MHPTYPLPRITPPVTPTRHDVAAGRDTLLTLAGHTEREWNAFLVGYLGRTFTTLADAVIDRAAREQITHALALIEAATELHRESLAAFTYTRPTDEETTCADIPAGVVGYPLGRYTR